jgi:hypothetical protein
MGLRQDMGKITYININKGKLIVKEKDKEPIVYSDLFGYITKVDFRQEEFNGKKFEVAKFFIQDMGDNFCLQMRTDSGYFRGLANSLKTGNPKEKFLIKPNFKEVEGKPKTTCFVTQEGVVLKHAYTLSNMGDLPPAEKVKFKDEELWDSTKQIEFWKNWFLNEKWFSSVVEETIPTTEKETDKIDEKQDSPELDDLPF